MSMQIQSKADLAILSGDPGSGKTTTGVKKLIDERHKALARPDPRLSRALSKGDTFEAYKYTTHIFANLHLFGIKYVYLPMEQLAKLINVTINDKPINDPDAIPLIGYGIYLYDEGSQGANARESTSSDTMVNQNLVTQSRKRHLKIIYVAQDVRLLTWEIKRFANEWIECDRPYKDSKILSRYDLITLSVKKDGVPEHSFDYHGLPTWKYFKSDELHPISQARLDRAVARSHINSESNSLNQAT